LIGSAMMLAFRTTGPLPQLVLYVTVFLGGVYYPTQVIPSWIQTVSAYVPASYGLRALRRVLLQGAGLREVLPDVIALSTFCAILSIVGVIALKLSLLYARRTGSLAQY